MGAYCRVSSASVERLHSSKYRLTITTITIITTIIIRIITIQGSMPKKFIYEKYYLPSEAELEFADYVMRELEKPILS
jgi:hypothetical protein